MINFFLGFIGIALVVNSLFSAAEGAGLGEHPGEQVQPDAEGEPCQYQVLLPTSHLTPTSSKLRPGLAYPPARPPGPGSDGLSYERSPGDTNNSESGDSQSVPPSVTSLSE